VFIIDRISCFNRTIIILLMMTTSYVTQATEWPSAATIPDDVQKLVALFYENADSRDPGAGRVLAEEVFSKNATLVSASGVFNGFNGGLYPAHFPCFNPNEFTPPRNFSILVIIFIVLFVSEFRVHPFLRTSLVRADRRASLQRLRDVAIMYGVP
jgi:hypothetical protein